MKQYMAERKAASQPKKNKGKNKNKNKGGKGGKGKGGGKKAPAGPKPVFDVSDSNVITCLDIRVGEILNCKVSRP